jgi:uncharacterized membrane protein YkoI
MARSKRGMDTSAVMNSFWISLAVAATLGLSMARAEANCFSPEETREHVRTRGLISLNDVVRSSRGAGHADLISARLCETAGNLVYMIAMLGRDGKLMRLTVDARTGDLINHR